MNQPRYQNGQVVSNADLDAIARAFGFTSARHLNQVMAGTAPSGLESPKHFEARRTAESQGQAQASIAEAERRAAENRADIERAALKHEQRRENHRRARYAVLARKRAETERAAS